MLGRTSLILIEKIYPKPDFVQALHCKKPDSYSTQNITIYLYSDDNEVMKKLTCSYSFH